MQRGLKVFNAMFQLTDVGFHQEETNHLPPVWMREKKTQEVSSEKKLVVQLKLKTCWKYHLPLTPKPWKIKILGPQYMSHNP